MRFSTFPTLRSISTPLLTRSRRFGARRRRAVSPRTAAKRFAETRLHVAPTTKKVERPVAA